MQFSCEEIIDRCGSVLLILLAGLVSALALSGCSDGDGNPADSGSADGQLTAIIDGISYSATWDAYAIWIMDPAENLSIVGTGPMSVDSCLVNLSLDTRDIGTYSIVAPGLEVSASVEFRIQQLYFSSHYAGSHGEIEIAQNTGGRVKGTFDFVLYRPNSDSVVVTEGYFDVPVGSAR